ncbi:MAG TPA: hypothetical protein VFW73_11490, partial [Lacipirellulaceae bacterium]|nr:hypothetical protein [Lacipirellulaceae bacterium]
PSLDMAYKLVDYAGHGRTKLSAHKAIYPGRKQFFRQFESGKMMRDKIMRADETGPGEPQLVQVMRGGQRIRENCDGLGEARDHTRRQLEALPADYHRLESIGQEYPIAISESLVRDLQELRALVSAPVRTELS